MRLRDKLETLNLFYHSTYCHQRCQTGNLFQEAPAHEVT